MSLKKQQRTALLSTQFIFYKLRFQWSALSEHSISSLLQVCVIEQDKRNWVWQTSSISACQKWDNEMHTPRCWHSWRQVFYFESGCSKSGGKVILIVIWNLGVIGSTLFALRSVMLSVQLTVCSLKVEYCRGINVTGNSNWKTIKYNRCFEEGLSHIQTELPALNVSEISLSLTPNAVLS